MMKVPFDSLPKELRDALIEAARAKRENWYAPSVAHNVVRDHWGVLRTHPDPKVREAMAKIEEATTKLVDLLLVRYEGPKALAAHDAIEMQKREIERLVDVQRSIDPDGVDALVDRLR